MWENANESNDHAAGTKGENSLSPFKKGANKSLRKSMPLKVQAKEDDQKSKAKSPLKALRMFEDPDKSTSLTKFSLEELSSTVDKEDLTLRKQPQK